MIAENGTSVAGGVTKASVIQSNDNVCGGIIVRVIDEVLVPCTPPEGRMPFTVILMMMIMIVMIVII